MQQFEASSPANSIWVEASAGTGKTKVLSDRVLRLLLSGVNPSRILCLTYTKAAASEMNNRILERLSKWATIDDETLITQLSNLLNTPLSYSSEEFLQARRLFAILLDTPGGIKIQTIHSFCQDILKRFPLEAKISPYFQVMDDQQTTAILNQIKLDILRNPSSKNIKDALNYLTEHCSEYSFPQILSSITDNCNLLEKLFNSYPDFNELIEHLSAKLDLSASTCIDDILASFWSELPQENLRILIQALDFGTETSQKKAIHLAQAIEDQNFDNYIQSLLTQKKEPQKNYLVKKSIEKFPQSPTIYQQETQRLIAYCQQLQNLRLRDSSKAVLSIAQAIINSYNQYKFLQSKIDYNDLIIKTKNLLNSPDVAAWVLYKLDGGIDHILIDEAQDTSPDQWAIIQALSQEFFAGMGSKSQKPTVFVVGDRKQSIYSFQGADVSTFTKMHQWFSQIAQPNFKTVNMEVSFRSTSAILDMVNTVFNQSSAAQGVASSCQTINHTPSRIGFRGHIELWQLAQPQSDTTIEDVWLPPIERITAKSASCLLAQKIAEMIQNKVSSKQLKADGTPFKYSDFLILIQRRNSFAQEMVRACKNAGINIAGIDKITLIDQIVVEDLLSLAKFALLPDDDLNLACALKSPIFNLDDNDLLELCYNRQEKTLWQQIQDNPTYQQESAILTKLIKLGTQNRPFEFFSYILNDLQSRRRFIARLGTECEDAIDEFINYSLSFEQEKIASLQLFIESMQTDNIEVKRNLEQTNFDAVRLMTVHGSKGLQAPVVILPDTVRIPSVKQEAGWIDDGDCLFYPLGKEYYAPVCSHALAESQTKCIEEYNRLLYVALTRAGEELYICGHYNKNNPSDNSWYEICRQSLNKLTQTSQSENIIYHIESSEIPPAQPKTGTQQPKPQLPHWIHQSAPTEDALSKPLTPSHQDEEPFCATSPLLQINNTRLYQRGNLIHKLLQFLPLQDPAEHQKIAQFYLKTQAKDIPLSQQNQIISEVLALINSPQFSPLFGKSSLAEVPLMGLVDNRIISGQIDRLVVLPHKVMIVDYKTNRPAAKNLKDVPISYIKQMRSYKQLIKRIYPSKQIECYILWTNTAHMMKIE